MSVSGSDISNDMGKGLLEERANDVSSAAQEAVHRSAAAFRTQRLRYALGASFGGKLSALVVQLVAMPVAVRALGTEQFALYSMLAAATVWLALSEVGVAPVLVRRIAVAAEKNDIAEQQRLFSSAIVLIGFMVLFSGGIAYGILGACPVEKFFGPHYVSWVTTIYWGFAILIGFSMLAILFTIVEAVQSAYQEQHTRLIWQSAANITCVGTLLASAVWWPTVVGMILAVNLPPYVARGLNGWFFSKGKPFLRPSFRACRLSYMRELLADGFFMWLAILSSLMCLQIPLLIVGWNLSPSSTACFAAGMNILVLLTGALAMIVWPVWPAMSHSHARGDLQWARSTYRKTLAVGLGFSAVVAVVLAAAGSRIVPLWLGPSIQPTTVFMTLLGAYFLVSTWDYVHFVMLLGLNRIRKGSIPWFLRSCLAIVSILFVVRWAGENGVLIALLCSVIFVSAVPMWSAVRNALNENLQPRFLETSSASVAGKKRLDLDDRETGLEKDCECGRNRDGDRIDDVRDVRTGETTG